MKAQLKQEYLLKIKTLINQGENKQASDLLVRVLKKSKLTSTDRIEVSKIYMWLGRSIRALKILGQSDLIRTESLDIYSDAVKIELRRAELYYYYGCHVLASDIIKRLSEEIVGLDANSAFLESQAKVAIGCYNFKLAYESFNTLVSRYPSHALYQIGLADALEGLGESAEAINRLENIVFEDKKLEGIRLQAIGEYFVKMNENHRALENFRRAEELFDSSDKTKDKAYLYQWRGVAYTNIGENDMALENLEKAKAMILDTGSQPTAVLACLYQISLLRALSPTEQACLFLFPTYSPYRQILLGKKDLSKYELHPWISSKILEQPERAIYFDGRAFQLVPSNEVENLEFDLSLSRLKAKDRAVIGLLGGALTGINDVLLWSYVYQENYLNKEIATDKLRKLVDIIKNEGFKVRRKNNTYFLDLKGIKKKLLVKP